MHPVEVGEDGQLEVDHGGGPADQELPLLPHHGSHSDGHEHRDGSSNIVHSLKEQKYFNLCKNGFLGFLDLSICGKEISQDWRFGTPSFHLNFVKRIRI